MTRAGSARRASGFSLVEMAVVLVVFALMLHALLMITGTQIANQRVKDTEQVLGQARQALLGFAAVNGRLPCPANGNVPSATAGAGLERAPTAAGCTGGQTGVLPWATLGLPETDAWGRRITYRVSALHSRTVVTRPPTAYGCAAAVVSPPAQAAFALCSPGDIQVRASAAGAALVTNVPAVMVSHGANGFGAWLPAGTQVPLSADADEQENHDGDAIVVERTPVATFDDQLVVLPATLIAQSMLQSGRLP